MTHLLVLAGTGEARQLLAQLATNPNIRITASLSGATDRPAAFGVETRIGGFGGDTVTLGGASAPLQELADIFRGTFAAAFD